jgi:hypothetical protein
MSAEKITISKEQDLTPIMTPKESEAKFTQRVDINDLLARVRKERQKENKVNLAFFSIFASLILVVGIILSL